MSGCIKVGPDFKKPEMELPSQWSEQGDVQSTQPNMSDDEKLIKWWEIFQDDILEMLVKKTIENNFDIKLAAARIRQTRASRDEAVSGLGPFLNSTGSVQRRQTTVSSIQVTEPQSPFSEPSQNNTGTNPQGSSVGQSESVIDTQYKIGFDASWELDIFGGVRRGIEAAEAELTSVIEDRKYIYITLVAETVKEYIELRGLQQRLNIARNTYKSQKHNAELIRERFQNGFVGGLDLANAEALAATTAAEIPQFEAAIQQKIYSISVLAGLEPTALNKELIPVKDIPSVDISHIVPIGIPSELLRKRPDIRRAEAKIHESTAQIGVAVSDLFPKFFITGSSSHQSDSASTLFDPISWVWSFGPSVSWNLFDSGKTKSTIRQLESINEQFVIEYKQTVINALQEVENALIASSKEKEHFQAISDAVEKNRKAVQIATILYEKGEVDFLEVLVAQRSLYSSEDAMTQSNQRLSTDLVALYKAIGGAWDAQADM